MAEVQEQSQADKNRERLLAHLAAADMSTAQTRVAFILNQYPDARDSDKILTLRYWRVFQGHLLGTGGTVDYENIILLENPYTIIRYRQKIQNEYGLYQASQRVKEWRGERQIQIRDEMVEDKPGIPWLQVHADESGKTGAFAMVGSLWVYNAFRGNRLVHALTSWKEDRGIRNEFHFNKVSRNGLETAKEFFATALGMSDAFSFKAIAVNKQGMRRPEQEVIQELYCQLVYNGLRHEFSTGRVAPPAFVQVWKDMEDGVDRLHLTRLRQELESKTRQLFGADATLHGLDAVDSKSNLLIQLADLFTGSVNRILNPPSEGKNHKDELAAFILESVGFTISETGGLVARKSDVAALITL